MCKASALSFYIEHVREKGIMRITVNGKYLHFNEEEIMSYQNIVDMSCHYGIMRATVTYRGDGEGILTPGSLIEVKDKMIFNVTITDNS